MTTYTRCVHFNGIQKVCAAGVDPMTKRDVSKPGMAVFPCLNWPGRRPCEVVCDQRREMTTEEVAAENAQIDAAVAAFEANLAGGRCPHCFATIQTREQVGRCQYARPCGHRLGQVTTEVDE